ncbi:MAG: hypothetical protein V4649_11940 [Bacteroidota bacterium]
MSKAASYILILFGLVLLWASTSRSAMEYITGKRDTAAWWGTYQGKNGDLVSMSYLDFIGRFKPPVNVPPAAAPVAITKNTVLYLHGDSYSRHLHDTMFAGVSRLYLIDRNHGLNYHLDSTKNNILLIEVAERYFRPYFGGLQMLNEVCDSLVKKKSIANIPLALQNEHVHYASLLPFSVDDLFNKYINQNLQCNLFNYNCIMPLFWSKASLNYYAFNRASGDVVISNDRQFLFYKETVSLTDKGSSYSPLEPGEIASIIANLDTIYDHYKASGFKEVYFSVIPNTATIAQPTGYNNLIPLIQNDPRLKMNIIDIYSVFKQTKQDIYMHGDTHWNSTGRQLWVDLVNTELAKFAH